MNELVGSVPLKNVTWGTMLALVVTGIIVVGCASPAPTPAPSTVVAKASETVEAVQSESALTNTAWQAEYFGEQGAGVPVIPDSYPSLHLMFERYSGYSSCNWFLGVYDLTGDELLLETPAITEGGCEADALAEQDTRFLGSLAVVNRYEIVGDKLYLYADEDQLILTMAPLDPLPFEGTTWDMKFFSTSPAYWQPVLQDTLITATFSSDQMTGNAGCNDYTAAYTRDGNRLTLGEITATENTCTEPEGIMEQESAYLSMLATAGMLAESGRSIQLLSEDGPPLMLYHGR